MVDPQKIAPGHADLFLERYERLRARALQLTERDYERAEDLLHDAFIQFTLSHLHRTERTGSAWLQRGSAGLDNGIEPFFVWQTDN